MKSRLFFVTALALTFAVAAAQAAFAHDNTTSATHRHGQSSGNAGPKTGGSAEMKGQAATPGMMREGMMQRMTGHGMMGGMGQHMMRVRPTTHLSVDDVQHHFVHVLKRRGNARLRVGKVEMKDDDTILAQIETVDGSLVEAFEVDRHSGSVKQSGAMHP